MNNVTWKKKEKAIARKAFNKAYECECKNIGAEVQKMINEATNPLDLWRIHDFLSEKREATDLTYDYRYSVLIRVFGNLLAEGWLEISDLDGLSEDKISNIKVWAESTKKLRS